MMKIDNLRTFFEEIKNISLLQRIFSWGRIRSLSYDAYEEAKALENTTETLTQENDGLQNAHDRLKQEEDHLREQLTDLKQQVTRLQDQIERDTKNLHDKEGEVGSLREADKKNAQRISQLQNEQEELKKKLDSVSTERNELAEELAGFRKAQQQKQEEYEKKVTELNSLKRQLDEERERIQSERDAEWQKRIDAMRKTWRNHEMDVSQRMRAICKRHNIEYVEEVPFKGTPDNVVRICGEYVVFDAKSPQTDDLSNFPTYIRQQAEAAKKYARKDDVKKEIFLVIPQNTTHAIDNFFYNLPEYSVHIISVDSLEPVLLSLQRIETYEFAEKLAPEDREQICRIIGRFAHTTKRRIQVDTFFSNEFINVLAACDSLPEEIRDRSVEFERGGKLNPPMERRAKRNNTKELEKETHKTRREAETEDIQNSIATDSFERIPLYKDEPDDDVV